MAIKIGKVELLLICQELVTQPTEEATFKTQEYTKKKKDTEIISFYSDFKFGATLKISIQKLFI